MSVRPKLALMLCAAGLSGCSGAPPIPGEEILGRFALTARLSDGGCSLKEVPKDGVFGFEGIISRRRDGQGAWFTVGEVSREGSWDGQRFEASYSVPARFEGGTCDNRFVVEERLHLAILSGSQAEALEGCPADPAALLLPGGVPVDPAAQVVPPGPTDGGYDAALACGLLTDRIVPEGACPAFVPCELQWLVEGGRRF